MFATLDGVVGSPLFEVPPATTDTPGVVGAVAVPVRLVDDPAMVLPESGHFWTATCISVQPAGAAVNTA